MTLNEWAAKTKRAILDDLLSGNLPCIGSFDEEKLKAAKSKGEPSLGGTQFHPTYAVFEFIYKDNESTTIFSVSVQAAERIVFMPVPNWVIENIWQGEVSGSYQFETDAKNALANFESLLQPNANAAQFEPKMATRRE